MAFLEEFDRNARGLPPESPELSTEDRALLEFATLMRAHQVQPSADECQRVLVRVRVAHQKEPMIQRTGRQWTWALAVATAAFWLLSVGLWTLRPGTTFHSASNSTGFEFPVRTDQPVAMHTRPDGAAGGTPAVREITMSQSVGDEFAGENFPSLDLKAAVGANSVETPAGKDAARILRAHGLVMLQLKGGKQWRVAMRGQALKAGDLVRASKRLDSSARLLGPDGSAVSIAPGAIVRYDGPRAWQLAQGMAQFDVAKRSDLAAFTVQTPQGQATALGTKFVLSVSGMLEKTGADGNTLCWVDNGKVALSSRNAATREIGAGQSGVVRHDGVGPGQERLSQDWLEALNAELASDHGIGQLVAQAEKTAEKMPLEVKSYNVTVTTVDQVARTFVDMVFLNNTDRRLEGTFYYPLPADASISEFNMYVEGKLVRGEVLEQQRARQVFEYIVRQQRDPALLEFAGGNLFKMRVFPIEPHSEKRVQLGYTQILPRSGGQVTYTFPLYSEMLLKNPLLDLSIEFRVASSYEVEDFRSPTHLCASKLSADGKRGALAFRAQKYSPSSDFAVTYKVPDAPECVALSNARPDDEQAYFMLQICPKADLPMRETPERLLMIVDGSASAAAQDYAIGTEFAATSVDLSATYPFALVRGGQRPEVFGGGFSLVDDDSSQKVRDYLQKIPPLGATDMLKTFAEAARLVPAGQATQIIYVGDGIDTVSELSGPALVQAIVALFDGKDVKVSMAATGSSYDASVLKDIAASLGGTFTRVEGADSIALAAGQVLYSFSRPVLKNARLQFEGIETRAVYSPQLGTVFANDTAVVFGRIVKGDKARVLLSAEADGQPFTRSFDVDFTSDQVRNRFIPRLWARAHMQGLLSQMGLGSAAFDAQLRQQIIETSVTYQIMSQYTAFLVLESEEDYARYGIKRSMKMWDWKGDVSEQEATKKIGEKHISSSKLSGSAQYSGITSNEKPTSMERSDIIVPENILWEAERGDHFETVKFGIPMGNRAFGDSDSKMFSPVISKNERAAGGGGVGGIDLDELIDIGGLDNSASSGVWGNRSGAGRKILDKKEDASPSSGRVRVEKRLKKKIAPYAYRPPSLVFSAGTKLIVLQIDQPLHSEQVYRRLLASGKGTLSTQLNFALALESDGRYSEALKALTPVLDKHPNLSELWLELGVLRYRLKDTTGGAAAFSRAVELSDEKERFALNERIAGLLGSLGQYAEAASRFEAFAMQADTAERAAQYASSAVSHYQNSEQRSASVPVARVGTGRRDVGAPLWERLLQRWPGAAQVLIGAGNWLTNNSRDLPRAVELLQSARKAGAANVFPMLIQALNASGRTEEAHAEFRVALAKADKPADVASLFYTLNSIDTEFCDSEALRLIQTQGDAARLVGALQYLSGYQRPIDKERLLVIRDTLMRKDNTCSTQSLALQILAQARQMSLLTESEISTLFANLATGAKTPEEISQVINLTQTLGGYGSAKEALLFAAKLLERQDLQPGQRVQLFNTQFSALQNQGKQKEAEAKALEAFQAATDERSAGVPPAGQPTIQTTMNEVDAYTPVWFVFNARLNRNEYEGASEIATRFAARFPLSQYMRQYFQTFFQKTSQSLKKDEFRVLVDKLSASYPDNSLIWEYRVRVLTESGNWREAAEFVRAKLKKIDDEIASHKSKINNGTTVETGIPPASGGGRQECLPHRLECLPHRLEDRQEFLTQRLDQRASLIELLARICSQDAELRAAFLKDAADRASIEDVIRREWTEACLSCLNASGDMRAYTEKLEQLHAAEPADPLWGLRLANAYLTGKKTKEGRKILEKLVEAQPENLDLLLQLTEVCEYMKDTAAVGKYIDSLVNSGTGDRLQNLASQWQQNRPAWALKVWQALARDGAYAQNGYATYQCAQLLQTMGREDEALAAWLKTLTAGSSIADSAMSSITNLLQQEQHLRNTETEVRKILTTHSNDSIGIFANLLLYQIEKKKNNTASALAALDAAAQLPLPPNDYNIGAQIARAFVDEKLLDRAEDYALNGGQLKQNSRNNLIQNATNVFNNHPDRELKLQRAILKQPNSQSSNARGRIIQILVAKGDLSAAETEMRNISNTQQGWEVDNAWQAVINGYRNRKEYTRALDLAVELHKLLATDNSGYQSSADNLLNEISTAVLYDKHAPKDAASKAFQFMLERSQNYFAGKGQVNHWNWGTFDKLRIDRDALARDAAASNDAERVKRAAQYRQYVGERVEAKKLFQRALTLPNANAREIQTQLLELYRGANPTPQYADALEVVERLHQQPGYDEHSYLECRVQCLYGLKRTDEAREVVRKAMTLRTDRYNSSWRMKLLGRHCTEAKDWSMAAEVYEAAIQFMRAESRGQMDPYTIADLFRSCAGAYHDAGEKEKSLDCYLRALSLLPRDTDKSSYYQQLIREAQERALNGQALDDAEAAYEKNAQAFGGAEKPILRIIFGEAYAKGGKTLQMLQQFRIAANLLPQDVPLRRQVIDGYVALNDNEAALEVYYEWAKFDPQNIDVYRGLGDLLRSMKRDDEALLAWATMAEVRPREAEGYAAYAEKLLQLKKPAEAASALRKAVLYRPCEYSIVSKLADTYQMLNETDKTGALWTAGEKACRQAMSDLPDDPAPWLNLGQFLCQQGRQAEAKAHYLKILGRQWPRFQNETYTEARERMQKL